MSSIMRMPAISIVAVGGGGGRGESRVRAREKWGRYDTYRTGTR